MKAPERTTAQLTEELESLRQRVAELETAEAETARMSEVLQRERRQLLSIFDSIDEVVYVADPSSHEIVYVNQATRALFGEDIVGLKCHEVFQRHTSPCGFCTNDKIFGENLGRSFIWEFRNEISNRWFRCIDRAIQWPDGRWLRYEMAVDIDERVQAEEEATRLSSAVKMSTESIVLTDLDGTITDANEATLRMYGTNDAADLIGKGAFDVIAPKDRERATATLAEVMEKGCVTGQEYSLLDKEGAEVLAEMSVAMMKDIGGEPIGLVAVIRGIAERKRTEDALRLRFVNLAETVARIFSLRDPYVALHQRGTAKLVCAVSERMGFDKPYRQTLYVASLLHDIGKVGIPEGILRKPGKLTEEEWGLVRTHPRLGYDILKDAGLPPLVAELALRHHEWMDGSGYPDGLGGDALSTEVRILSLCNVVNAMSLRTPYRLPRSREEIVGEIEMGKGTKYDAEIATVLVDLLQSDALEPAE